MSNICSDFENKVDTNFDTDVDTNINNDVNIDVDTDINTNFDTDVDTNVDIDINTNFDTNVNTNVDIDINTNFDTDVNTNVDTNVDNDVNTNINTNVDNDINTNIISKSETILSIDIGEKNLGYTIYNENIFKFGLFNITQKIKEKKLNENIEGRNQVLIKWLNHQRKKYNITKIVVEKQVIKNVVAMCIESCILTFALMYKLDFLVFDPKNKFTFTEDRYDSKKKEHKKLAIKYAINTIKNIDESLLEIFNQYEKKDDISDSIVMALMSHSNTDLKKYKMIIKN